MVTMKRISLILFLVVLCHTQLKASKPDSYQGDVTASIPHLQTGRSGVDKAFRLAIGDLFTNIQVYKDGLLPSAAPVMLAGLDYGRPWTRDAAINSWNAGSLIIPEVAKNTLLSVLTKDGEAVRIGGQYWDAIVWSTAAWYHYLCTGDREFLELALKATVASLGYYERTEFNPTFGLFRGLGWSDGVAAYPGKYANMQGNSAAWSWPQYNADKKVQQGYGIPMMAISTNCLYYSAYRTTHKMAQTLETPIQDDWLEKAEHLRKAINKHLWNEEVGVYRFYIDEDGACPLQETLGNAYAILFGIADGSQAEQIFNNQYVAPAGVPCGWPPLDRYQFLDHQSFGRHNGTVWPQIQAFWASAAAENRKCDIFAHELLNLAKHAVRDMQFVEIYHPLTGKKYGGWQERGSAGIVLWEATNRQTWAATGFLRMVFYGLIGVRLSPEGIHFEPCVPQAFNEIRLSNVKYRRMRLNIAIKGSGTTVANFNLNGRMADSAAIPGGSTGTQEVEIHMQR